MADKNTIIIKSFPIPDGWRESETGTVAVGMPPFTKIVSVGYDEDDALVAWGVVRTSWETADIDYSFHIRKSNEEIGGSVANANFIDMVTIDDEPHAVFTGGTTT